MAIRLSSIVESIDCHVKQLFNEGPMEGEKVVPILERTVASKIRTVATEA